MDQNINKYKLNKASNVAIPLGRNSIFIWVVFSCAVRFQLLHPGQDTVSQPHDLARGSLGIHWLMGRHGSLAWGTQVMWSSTKAQTQARLREPAKV